MHCMICNDECSENEVKFNPLTLKFDPLCRECVKKIEETLEDYEFDTNSFTDPLTDEDFIIHIDIDGCKSYE